MSQEKNQVLSDDDVNMVHHEEPVLDEKEKNNKDTENEGSSSSRENSVDEKVKENSEKDQASVEKVEEEEEEEEVEEEEKGSDYEDKSDKEEEYEIEKIVGHRTFKGKVVEYEIKWKGYSEEENTKEKATTIHSDVPDLCEKYWDSLGVKRPLNAPGYGKSEALDRPKKTSKERSTVLGKRSREEEQERMDRSRLEHVPRCMIDKGFVIPKTYPNEKTKWDSELKQISAVQLSPVDKSIMLTYVEWNNGQRTIHEMSEVHEKCPEALIDYYEARLRFV